MCLLGLVTAGSLTQKTKVHLDEHFKTQSTANLILTFSSSTKRNEHTMTPAEIAHRWQQIQPKIISLNDKLSKRNTGGEVPVVINEALSVVPSALITASKEAVDELIQMDEEVTLEYDRPLYPFLPETVELVGAKQVRTPSMGGDESYDGRGWVVAVLDTGFDVSSPYLRNKIVGEGCFVTAQDYRCPNGAKSQTGPGAARAAIGATHGSLCASIAAGAGNGLTGVAAGSDLLLVNVFGEFANGTSTQGASTSAILLGLQYVHYASANYSIAAASLSLGGGYSDWYCDDESPSLRNLVSVLAGDGIAVVVASGNEGYEDGIAFPACLSQAVSVGATNKGDTVARFSNSAEFLTIVAPGVQISSLSGGTQLAWASGTSMATPVVSAAFAIYRSVQGASSTVSAVTKKLVDSGVRVVDGKNGLSFSRLNIRNALWGQGGSCGNGKIDTLEECDDGNNFAGDGCAQCDVEPMYRCTDAGCVSIINTTSISQVRTILANGDSYPTASITGSKWNLISGQAGVEVYSGSGAYLHGADSFGDEPLTLITNFPSAPSGQVQKLTLNFAVRFFTGTERVCTNSLFVLINGQPVRSLSLPYTGVTVVDSDDNPTNFPGLSGWCSNTAINGWNVIDMDVSPFGGRSVQIQFNYNGQKSGGSFRAVVDDITLIRTLYSAAEYPVTSLDHRTILDVTETDYTNTRATAPRATDRTSGGDHVAPGLVSLLMIMVAFVSIL